MDQITDAKRQLNKKDTYCIYRKKKKGKDMCTLSCRKYCSMYTDNPQSSCYLKVSQYRKELDAHNTKKEYIFGVEVEYVSKIDKKLKPAQHSLDSFTESSSKNVNTKTYNLNHNTVDQCIDYGPKWETKNWTNFKYKETVYVFQGFLHCANHHSDSLSHGQVIVKNLKGTKEKHRVNLIYCSKCKKYYIDGSHYKDFIKQRILLDFRVKTSYSQGYGFDGFRPESELHLYGYNVRSSTPKSVRQQVLYDVVSNRLIRVEIVVSHLQGLISLSESRNDRTHAVKRYREDMDFLYERFPGASMEHRTLDSYDFEEEK